MSKKKKGPVPEPWDIHGPAGGSLQEGYTWCPNCQASFQGEVCPGCSPGIGDSGEPTSAESAEAVAEKAGQAFEEGKTTEAGPSDPTTLAEVAELASTETTTITEILPVPLTDPEYKEFGIKLGLANQEISQAEDELASVKSQYKSRIVSAEGRRNEYSAIINAGHQQKQVECNLIKDFHDNTITLIRQDTFEVVRTRTMTANERQRGLFPPGPPTDPSCIDPTD